ncbi:WD40 repeat-containing protein [Calothrix sp. PCC 7507]|uniref:nSTAND1 domain-containing NTPase n=1 Tax=Calothrix sp. PCC 7507 TaxID=99598 RepID=UPI00029EDE80|nr:WD40 repeat-containing protein [Calothrix sp. PCC 7507]AFY35989.1 WD40 repeat-containing protein [Calothrix sp. PCC 7507]
MSQEFPSNQEARQKISHISMGDSNVVTLNQTQILQIAVDEIKTRQFIATSPYKGLKKFEPEDKDLFFGRDQFLTGLVNELEQTNLILLLGASGSGKSSLVRAGLIPWLSQKWGSRLVNFVFTPDVDPFESFYASLLGKYKQSEVQIAREAKADTLNQVLTRLKQPDDYWFILIDQFEELFTNSHLEKRNQFIASLVQLSKTKQHAVKIVATMRADFLDRLSPYPQLVKATDKHRPFIAEMQRDELRLAIEQPAAQRGVVFETGLVEEIITNIEGQAGYLPLLQYTLNLLWETEVNLNAISDRTLNINTYRQLGGVRGALHQRVEAIYNNFTAEQQLCVQRIFLKLVEIGGDEESGTDWKPVRKRAMRSEFSPEEAAVLTQLIDQSLLVSNYQPEADISTLEIAHEALLTSWTRLHEWIGANRQAIALRNRLNEDVLRWQNTKADDELWSGSRLEQTLELRRNEAFNSVLGGFSEAANQFINASSGRRDRQRRKTIIGLSAFSTVALALATFSTVQYQRAESRQITALRQTSEARFANNRHTFDALIDGLEASDRYQSLFLGKNPQTQADVQATLAEAVYWTRERDRLQAHEKIVQSVIFSPDGQILATASYDKTIKLWRTDGSLINTLPGHTKPVTSVKFSPNGQILASASQDGTVILWHRDGKYIRTIPAHNSTVYSVSFSPDGKTIATSSKDKTAKLWQLDGKLLQTFKGHSARVRQAIFIAQDRIITISDDTKIRLWGKNDKPIKEWTGHNNAIMSADFSPKSGILATASSDQTVKLWGKEGQPPKILPHSEPVNSVSFHPDGETIASGSFNGTVKLWRKDGTLIDTWASHEGQIPSLNFSPDGKLLATASNDKTIKLWQVNRSLLTVLVGHQGAATSPRFSPDNSQQVVSVGEDGMIRLWSLKGKLLSTWPSQQKSAYGVGFSPDGRTIATGGTDATIKLWSRDGKFQQILQGHTRSVNTVIFSRDIIASASDDGTAKLWSLDGKELHTLKGHNGRVLNVNFSPDGKTIATTGDDGTVKLWRLDGTEIRTIPAHKNSVWSVGFSPDGKTIATASSDKTIKIWSLAGNLIKTLNEHNASVLDVSFSPDGKKIATASSDKTIKIWQPDGKLITTLMGHKSEVNAVSFSRDSKLLASSSADGIVLLWDVSDMSFTGFIAKGCNQIHDYLKSHHSCK